MLWYRAVGVQLYDGRALALGKLIPLLAKRTLSVLLDYPEVELVIEVRLFDSLIGEVGFINFGTFAVIIIIIIIDNLFTVLVHDHRRLIELVLVLPRRSIILLVLVERFLPLLLLHIVVDAARHQAHTNDVLVQSTLGTAAALIALTTSPLIPLTA